MQQIVNITEARNDLSNLVSKVSKNRKPVVIIRDSKPEAVLVSYQEFISNQEEQKKLWDQTFENLQKEGKKAFRIWAKKRNIDVDKLTEEEVYDLIDKV
ncbi:hypothetical protein A3I51_01375 [Candidatus Gottesmanbacteria bacterium RIFCSPLOWO2_02_FULL_38_8]|uniref:Antitoxin n=1 Tax=Candidatus Gottesmanbacteria bacterium RIFCSPLOWO2_02_FULL_38_8 TaxID=1798397 RepID=A0A1F6B2T8_9BACT|nr:MAG: hypothetical protein A3I51_01375 [Candidatus Gottesmanbacteria bacterium RIFCSPLOWO2_02_FULL_38_8]